MKNNKYDTFRNYGMFSCPTKEEMRDKTIGLVGFLLAGALVVGLGYFAERRDFTKFVDTNKDGIVSTNELKVAYDELGVNFNSTNPIKLTSKQIGEYLDNHDPVRIEAKKREVYSHFNYGK